jgi:hypothetical protein
MSKKLDCKHITSVTQLRRCGYGVDAVVLLKKPNVNISGEHIGPPIGTRGIVVSTFGARPVIKWDRPGKYGAGPQVVEPEFLMVTKRSAKPEVIATVPLARFKEFMEHGQGERLYADVLKGSKVVVFRRETIYDDVGYDVGEVYYKLRGKIKGNKVEFTSTSVDTGGIPRRQRWSIRNDFDSHDPKMIFAEILED